MSKLLIAATAAVSMLAAAPVFAQGAPQWLLQQNQTNGYQLGAQVQSGNGVAEAQAQQPEATQVAINTAAGQSGITSAQQTSAG